MRHRRYVGYDEGGQLTEAVRRKPYAVVLDPKAKVWVAEKGYDPVFGARPLRRFLQRHLETRLARGLIAGEVEEGAKVTFTVEKDALVLAPGPRSAGSR
ncbi:MAG: ATP-dependent Clp protease ATP-binding subunit [Candidatus Didemnitutus sp.]|nr:ATP-dependent Clp protease ATP-binding subunit [Candidatus Didemnitutus sp.]